MAPAHGGLTTRQKGCLRDREILLEIERRQALNTEQVRSLFFKDLKSGRTKAQERLLKLYQGGRVKRCRVSLTEPYCYYTGPRHGRLEHLLDLNWVYVWFTAGLKAWEQVHCFNYEPPLGILQPDAFCGIRNSVTGRCKFWFVELDRSANDFDKVEKYNQYYGTEAYIGQWWRKLADRFPTILVVTTTARRATNILKRIKDENEHGLNFKVMLLNEIKEGLL